MSQFHLLLETNADCPGGILLTGLIKQCYQNLAFYHDYIKSDNIVKMPMDEPTLFVETLVNLYQDVVNSTQSPYITFLSSNYRPLNSEMDLLPKIATLMELASQHNVIQNLKMENNNLTVAEHKIDLVYQKSDSFIDTDDQVHYCLYQNSPTEIADYLKLLKERKFLAVNSFPSILVAENKRVLALLQLPEFQAYFTEQQKLAIKELCPKTFSLTSHQSINQEIVNEVIKHKDDYVLKRVIDTQGRGVTMGREASQEKWHTLITHAIDRPFVIQEFIAQKPPLVYSADITPRLLRMNQTLSLFLLQGKASGLVMRSAPELITNINQTGLFQNVYVTK